MKKILVLLGMLALASGAWAADLYSYSWAVTIADVPVSQLPEQLVGYLIDTSVKDSKVMYEGKGAVLARTELVTKSQKTDGTWMLTYQSTFYDPAGNMTAGDVLGATDVTSFNSATFEVGSTDVGKPSLQWNFMGQRPDEVNAYAKENLIGIILSPATGSYLPLEVTANNSINHLGSWGTFTDVVPEPTSGLLLLLGVAGLALKRKKAA